MKVLIACEESQAVCIEFRKRGHDAYSCDIMEPSGEHPEWHIQGDVIEQLEKEWDMIIAFPPCTHLSKAGAAFWKEKREDGRQQEGIDFFMQFLNLKCKRIAIENPPGIISTLPKWIKKLGLSAVPEGWRVHNQIIHPWWFGEAFNKPTCLWLKGLPPLMATKIVGRGEFYLTKKGRKASVWFSKGRGTEEKRRKIRSKTFPGIARAMAEQWG